MANGSDHAVGAFVAVLTGHALVEVNETGEVTGAPLVSASFGALLGSLPDVLEPAIHPHHRQFFHSVAFGLMVGWGMHRLYRWQPNVPSYRVARAVGLIAGTAYLAHLLMDAGTPRSIPLLALR